MADLMVNVQAQIIAFSHDYQLVMIFIRLRDPARDHDRLDQGRAAHAGGRAGTCGDRVGSAISP